DRLLEEMRVCRDTLFVPEAAAMSFREWSDQVVDQLAHTHAANPSFQRIVCDPAFSPEMAAAEAELQRDILDGVTRVCAAWRPDPAFALAELKTLLRSYFEPIVGANATR